MATLFLAVCLGSGAAAQSRSGELRGAWIQEGYGRDWPAIMRSLAGNGFNALFACFSIGNVAYYPSEALGVAPGVESGRDELAEAARAAKEHGIELHVWRIHWALWRTPPEMLEELDRAGQLQRNSLGERGRDDPKVKGDWLCPSHPENRELEREAMLELVRRYDIAGIHFDYMRFPGGGYCLCDHCREQFEKDASVSVARWPDDVLEGGSHAQRWRQWRQELQTSLVEEISDEARVIKPGTLVSLAAWPNLETARGAMAQDWPGWVRAGVLDFVCPMDYTVDRDELARLVEAQITAVRGEVPLYAGLAAFRMKSAWALGKQVETVREAGADGFVAFAYDSGDLEKWLPQLRSRVTAGDPDPMPHRGPPARFAFAGPAIATMSGRRQAITGEKLEVELAVGHAPARSPEEESGEGAAQAASMLRRVTDARTPITSYERNPDLITGFGEEERISGRIVVETPSGVALLTLGAFDTDAALERTVRFVCPEGPFRVAVHGATRTGAGEPQQFVVRSPLFRGVPEEELQAGAVREALNRLCAEACERSEVRRLDHVVATLQIRATGAGGGEWWLRLREGGCESGEGSLDDPDVTFVASAEDLLAIARGELNPRALWEMGRLQASGDFGLLRELAEGLER